MGIEAVDPAAAGPQTQIWSSGEAQVRTSVKVTHNRHHPEVSSAASLHSAQIVLLLSLSHLTLAHLFIVVVPTCYLSAITSFEK